MKTRRRPIRMALAVLGMAALACSTFTGIFGEDAPATQEIQGPDNANANTAENNAGKPADEGSTSESSNIEAQEAETADLPFPYVEDAYEVEDFFGTYTYLTDQPVDEVAEFYRSEMAALGYELDAEAKVMDGFILSFKKEGSIVTMNVIENADGSVLVRYAEASP